MTFLAGPLAAESMGAAQDGGVLDRDRAEGFALSVLITDDAASAYLERLEAETKTLLSLPHIWSAVEALAGDLLENRHLSWDDVKRVVRPILFD